MWLRMLMVLGLAAGSAAAQTADELVAKNVEARGGRATLQAVETVRIERTVAAVFNDIDLVIYKKRPDRYRSDQTIAGSDRTTTRAFGDVAWETAGGRTAVRDGAGPAEQREADADFDGFLVDYRRKGHDVALEGRARVAGADTFKLKVTLKSGAVRVVYLDAVTFLERRHETTIALTPDRRVATTIDFDDWRDVQGVKFPFAIQEERDAPGQTFVHYTKRIELNVPIDDALFRMPAS